MGFSASDFEDILNKIIYNKIVDILEKEDVLVRKTAIVASVNGESARVYFPTDMKNMSCPYPNKSGVELSVGDKVYVYHKFGKESQGWIMVKA